MHRAKNNIVSFFFNVSCTNNTIFSSNISRNTKENPFGRIQTKLKTTKVNPTTFKPLKRYQPKISTKYL